ncbi:MAG: histone deacetylase [Deltaproteobacteria bacterium]|jgi:acetoin utilization deacetylase AcuC-like enzyme|nr:histone deacetylase [Deltaproteobacteria bacterium]
MKIFYTDTFSIPLPENHSFPKDKYRLLRMLILENLGAQPVDLKIPEPATYEDIIRTHDPVYIHRLQSGELSAKEVRRVGFPWSAEMVRRARYSAGATIEACRAALEEGIAVNLGGGTHHAFSDHGQGYCWLNDSVIASRAIQAEGLVKNILIIDCDVHQGNGTAVIVQNDPTIFTFSIHGKNNFPHHKETSDLDVELADGTEDAEYLKALENGLDASMQNFKADLVIYLAGADPYEDDRFGRLALTKKGLAERDRLVFQNCLAAGLPTAVTMAGGYAPNVLDTVDIHFQTVLSALEFKN